MLAAALWYAQRFGWYVIPLHNPIFDDSGTCVGCTCEDYKRQHPERYRPNNDAGTLYVCPNPGKHPRINDWETRATVDPVQIKKWFGHAWQDGYVPNIGVAAGKSRLLFLDKDSYKDVYPGEAVLSRAEQETVTALTGGGGEHLIYSMGEADTYGNATGNLPAGIDIRGDGGFVVAPPSLHASGNRYQFEAEYGPHEIDLLPIPDALRAALDAGGCRTGEALQHDSEAVRRSCEVVEQFLDHADIPSSDAQQWGRDGGVKWILNKCPFNPASDPHANDNAAYVTVLANGAISAGCHHARCQHVIKEEAHNQPWRWLRSKFDFLPAPDPTFGAQLATLRTFVHTADFSEYVPIDLQAVNGYRTAGTDKPVADAILDICAQAGRFERLRIGMRDLRKRTNKGSLQTIQKSLERLLDWFVTRETEDDGRLFYWVQCDLCAPLQGNPRVDRTRHNYTEGYDAYDLRVGSVFNDMKADDLFALGRSKTGRAMPAPASAAVCVDLIVSALQGGPLPWVEISEATGLDGVMLEDAMNRAALAGRIQAVSRGPGRAMTYDLGETTGGDLLCGNVLRAFNAGELLILSALDMQGDQTRKELAAATGLKLSSTGRATARLAARGVIDADTPGNGHAKTYSLCAFWRDTLEELRPQLRSHMCGTERQDRDAEQMQRGADRQLAGCRPEDRDMLERRRTRAIVKRQSLLQILYPEWAAEEIDQWILSDHPTHRPYIDTDFAPTPESLNSDYTGLSFALDMHRQSIPEHEWFLYSQAAGYTDGEQQRIEAFASLDVTMLDEQAEVYTRGTLTEALALSSDLKQRHPDRKIGTRKQGADYIVELKPIPEQAAIFPHCEGGSR